MNRIFIISAILIVIIAAGALFMIFSSGAPAPAPTQTHTPVSNNSGYSATAQQNQNMQAVQVAYQNVLSKNNVDNIKLYQTAVSGGYALQSWRGDNTGGEALLKFDEAQGKWVILSPGGGAWSVEGLVQLGVPQSAAEALVAGMPR